MEVVNHKFYKLRHQKAIMINYFRNLTLAAALFVSSSAQALEVDLVGKTKTPWTSEQDNAGVVYGFGIVETQYKVRLTVDEVMSAANNRDRFLDDIAQRVYDLEKKDWPCFTLSEIRRKILCQHPEMTNSQKPLKPTYDFKLKRPYGWGLMVTM